MKTWRTKLPIKFSSALSLSLAYLSKKPKAIPQSISATLTQSTKVSAKTKATSSGIKTDHALFLESQAQDRREQQSEFTLKSTAQTSTKTSQQH